MEMLAGVGILGLSLTQPLGIFETCWCSTMTLDRPVQTVVFAAEGSVS